MNQTKICEHILDFTLISLYTWLDAAFFWVFGILLLVHMIKMWNDPRKKGTKYSELIEVLLFGVQGFLVLTIFTTTQLTQIDLSLIFFLIIFSLIVIFPILNVVPNVIKIHFNPAYRSHLTYEGFLEDLAQKYKVQEVAQKADKFKDITRKGLHLIQFVGIVAIHEICMIYSSSIERLGYTPIQFRNFLYFSVAGIFFVMMMTGDLIRMKNWRYLPNWAQKWYEKSIEPAREEWTMNSATPIILANLSWTFAFIPFQIFFSAAWISCIADAGASFIGKNYGHHKMSKMGKFPNKTFEGLITGICLTIIGIFAILSIYPVAEFSLFLNIFISFGCGIIFALIDLYGNHISDNLTNSLLSGIFVGIFFLIT